MEPIELHRKLSEKAPAHKRDAAQVAHAESGAVRDNWGSALRSAGAERPVTLRSHSLG